MKHVVRKCLVVAAGLALSVGAASAAAPQWTYVEAGYLNVNPDNVSESGDNWFLGGAFGGKYWHVIGQYASGDLVPGIDLTNWRLGVGFHGLLGEPADLVVEAYYVDSSIASFSENGYRVTGGIRWRIIKLIEVDGFVNYTDISSDSDTSYELRGIVNIWRVGLGVGYEVFDDVDQWNVFARFNFGKN